MLHAICTLRFSQCQRIYTLHFPWHSTVYFTCSEMHLFTSFHYKFTLSRTLYGSSFKISPPYAKDETKHSYSDTQSQNYSLSHKPVFLVCIYIYIYTYTYTYTCHIILQTFNGIFEIAWRSIRKNLWVDYSWIYIYIYIYIINSFSKKCAKIFDNTC